MTDAGIDAKYLQPSHVEEKLQQREKWYVNVRDFAIDQKLSTHQTGQEIRNHRQCYNLHKRKHAKQNQTV